MMKTTSVFVLPARYLECRQENWFRRQVLKAQAIALTPASLLYRSGPIFPLLATLLKASSKANEVSTLYGSFWGRRVLIFKRADCHLYA